MEIGFSFLDLAPGGAQQLLVQLACELARLGHTVKFTVRASPDDHHHVDPYLLSSLLSIGNKVNPQALQTTCQVIHLDGYHSIRHKIPLFSTMNKWVETFHSKYSVQRSGPLYAPRRVAVSRYIQSLLPPPTCIIPNGIKPPVIQKVTKEFDLAILGRIHPVKRQDFFLDICEEIFLKRHHLSCLLIGGFSADQHYRKKILSQVSSLRSNNMKIHITGFVPYEQVFTWLAKTKLLIIPSQDEGFGRMAIEALACGIPVIANPVGGLLEIIDHNLDGFFPELDQLASFVHFTDYLLQNPSLCEEMGDRGQQKVHAQYTIEKVTSLYLDIYQSIVTESP